MALTQSMCGTHLAYSRRSLRTRGGTSSVRRYVVQGRRPESLCASPTARTKLLSPRPAACDSTLVLEPFSPFEPAALFAPGAAANDVAAISDGSACGGSLSSTAAPLEGFDVGGVIDGEGVRAVVTY